MWRLERAKKRRATSRVSIGADGATIFEKKA